MRPALLVKRIETAQAPWSVASNLRLPFVWRGLNDWLKHSEIEQQIATHPKLMQRPVIQDGDRYYLGWTDAIQSALLD